MSASGSPNPDRPALASAAAPAPASTPATSGAPVTAEEAGSQALSEALRSSFAIVRVIMAILVVVFLASGVFTVPSQGVAVILRFGKPVGDADARLLKPGLHWAFPYPIDEVVHVPVGQLQSLTSTAGWYATTPEDELAGTEPEPNVSLNPAIDGYTITGDGNIIHVRSVLRYRISDPIRYLFHHGQVTNMLQNALNNALFFASAQFTVDDALRNNIAGFREKVLGRVNTLVEEQGLGVTIEPSDFQVLAPRQVKQAFQEVLAAQQDASNARDTARAYANEILNRAQGEATALVNAGQSARTRLVQAVEAEARYFTDQLPHYERDPDLFRRRVQLETVQRLMTNAQVEKWFLPERADGQPRELRLQLNPEPRKPAVKEPERPDTAPLTKGDPRRR
jgi:membrane protease subunit HflK